MSEEGTEYKEGSHSEFIRYLFGSSPKPPNTIVLESPINDTSKNPELHIFEQLLMIFVDGLKYFHGDDQGKIDINQIAASDLSIIHEYFHSMGYESMVDVFPTINEYKFRYPDYFKDQDKITESCVLRDFYYEIYGHNNVVFRISFMFKIGNDKSS
jgi:hypothetical protein